MTVDDFRLSAYERRLLGEIETGLSADRELRRLLRPTLRERVRARVAAVVPEAVRAPHPVVVAALGGVSIALLLVGARTQQPAVIRAFAVTWPLTAYLAFRLVCRWSAEEP
ncbi:DUF3040 domain-containing protein [Streptomyces sp. WG-D5]